MDELIGILREIRPEFEFRDSQDFVGDGMLDSLDVVTLVAALDQRYRISIRGVEIVPENFRNLETIAVLLRKHGVTG
ncbi:MAG: acyl carrier protein [Bryobacteraceae bacterium]|jgi:acyl carrier protein